MTLHAPFSHYRDQLMDFSGEQTWRQQTGRLLETAAFVSWWVCLINTDTHTMVCAGCYCKCHRSATEFLQFKRCKISHTENALNLSDFPAMPTTESTRSQLKLTGTLSCRWTIKRFICFHKISTFVAQNDTKQCKVTVVASQFNGRFTFAGGSPTFTS